MADSEPPIDDVAEPLRLPADRPILTARDAAGRASARRGVLHVVGAEGSAPALVARALAQATRGPVLYVAEDSDAARRAAADLAYLSRGLPFGGREAEAVEGDTLLLVPSGSSPYAEVHPDRRAAMARSSTLARLAAGLSWRFLVTTAAGLVRRAPPTRVLVASAPRIVAQEELDTTGLIQKLLAAGYLRVPVVEDPGSFALRGGIVDVWGPDAALPVRAELEGDRVMSLRGFDPEDQRTLESVESVWLPPAREAIVTSETEERALTVMRSLCDAVDYPSTKARRLAEDVSSGNAFFGAEGYLPAFYPLEPLLDSLPADAPLVVEDPVGVLRALDEELERAHAALAARAGAPHFPVDALYVERAELGREIARRSVVAAHRTGIAGASSGRDTELERLQEVPPDAPTLAMRDQTDLQRAVKAARSAVGRRGALDPLARRIDAWHDAGLSVAITARGATQAERVGALLSQRHVAVAVHVGDNATPRDPSAVQIVVGELARGVIAPAEGFVLVTEEEIFGQRRHRAPPRKRSVRALLEDLRALAPGDHVVHVEHGIGRYLGLERRSIGDVSVELLVVEYQGGDKLFVPVYRLNQIQKYSGGESSPRLDRLGGQSFSKTKAKLRRRVRQIADDLLRLYAGRAAQKKEPLPGLDNDYAAFEAGFPYEETRDQTQAIAEVMRDLDDERVMDRLVCGDVGFGKTEVALRAAFRVVMAGRQVALLCPTTVLAQQHYFTFSTRLRDYPLTVRVLSRFESKKEQQDTLKGLKQGTVDVLIGTHRLLSKDVHFKKLGLLVVDEEQRFGVTHKERIKQLRQSVDALTLSATPIPRTLQMAVAGLRDMSLITTAPVDRRAIRTITSRFDEGVVRDAVEHELSRGGQVFYVYNRVQGIYECAARLAALVPTARIAVGHGQMKESALERTMLDFVAGEYDVLVATAIIESGLDIPRANTMIIDRADLFGLPQLYQLRGRVGRSSERAYCYLLVPPSRQLSDDARMRIEALERYTELGSGFHIATLDMELRGAGDLLGAEQSGFVASVGLDLFVQMLEEATQELSGELVTHEVDPDLSLDVDALLPEDYIDEVGVRLSFYKRLASAADEAEVDEIAAGMQDRFGPPPLEARRLVELMRLKTGLRKLSVLGIEAGARRVTLHLRDDTPLDPVKVGGLVARRHSPYKLTPDARLTRRALDTEAFPDGLALADVMLGELSSCLKTGSAG